MKPFYAYMASSLKREYYFQQEAICEGDFLAHVRQTTKNMRAKAKEKNNIEIKNNQKTSFLFYIFSLQIFANSCPFGHVTAKATRLNALVSE